MTGRGNEPTAEGTVIGAQGLPLYWRIWQSPEPRAGVMLLHGLGEHSGRYAEFAGFLAKEGFSTFAYDQRGHGRSGGPRGDVDAFPRFLEDLVTMEEAMETHVDSAGPQFLVGHSLGGLVGLRRVQTIGVPYGGCVLSAPWLATALPSWIRALVRMMGWVAPAFPFPSSLGPHRLTSDPEIARAWEEDPLIHTRVTGRLFREAERTQGEVLARPEACRVPLLFLLPDEDRVVDGSVTEAFAEEVGPGKSSAERLPGRRHEPLNDLGRDAVYRKVVAWLRERVDAESSLPPGPYPG